MQLNIIQHTVSIERNEKSCEIDYYNAFDEYDPKKNTGQSDEIFIAFILLIFL